MHIKVITQEEAIKLIMDANPEQAEDMNRFLTYHALVCKELEKIDFPALVDFMVAEQVICCNTHFIQMLADATIKSFHEGLIPVHLAKILFEECSIRLAKTTKNDKQVTH